MQSTPTRIRMDSYEMRASIGMKSVSRSIAEAASAGKSAALEATRRFAQEGNQMLDSYGKGDPIIDIAMSRVMDTTETIMAFSPSAPIEMDVDYGSLNMQYTMDQLSFDWQVQERPQMDFVPGSIEFTVTQYPSVHIEYIGEPIYVPPSSNPNYVPDPILDAQG